MAARLKMKTTTTTSASSPVWHEDFYFQTVTSRRRWCRLQSCLCFIVIRFGYDEGLRRLNFISVFLILRWQKEEGRQRKKKFLNSSFTKVGCCSLDTYCQGFCWVFVCAVILLQKRRTCLVLRSKAIHNVGII
jgi:hypothetical protein